MTAPSGTAGNNPPTSPGTGASPDVRGAIDADAARWRVLTRLFDALDGGRVLGVTHAGPFGVETANRRLTGRLARALSRARPASMARAAATDPAHGEAARFSGRPVLVETNDHRRELWNGDVGVLLTGADGRRVVAFRRGGGAGAVFVTHGPGAVDRAADGLALTVHKSQGAEYGEALLLLPERATRTATRELVYTGLTRAKKRAVLFGRDAAVRAALASVVERGGGLDLSPPDAGVRTSCRDVGGTGGKRFRIL